MSNHQRFEYPFEACRRLWPIKAFAWGDRQTGGDTSHALLPPQGVSHIEASHTAFAAMTESGISTWEIQVVVAAAILFGSGWCLNRSRRSRVRPLLRQVVTWGNPDHKGGLVRGGACLRMRRRLRSLTGRWPGGHLGRGSLGRRQQLSRMLCPQRGLSRPSAQTVTWGTRSGVVRVHTCRASCTLAASRQSSSGMSCCHASGAILQACRIGTTCAGSVPGSATPARKCQWTQCKESSDGHQAIRKMLLSCSMSARSARACLTGGIVTCRVGRLKVVGSTWPTTFQIQPICRPSGRWRSRDVGRWSPWWRQSGCSEGASECAGAAL